jgi:CubicO group peptidase (beta-lactamase class C family)
VARELALHAVTLPEARVYASPMLTSGEPFRRDPSASASNWQEPPVNRWSFWHVRELLPTHPVPRGGGPVRPLPDDTEGHDVLAVETTRVDGSRSTVGDVLDDTWTDAYAVLQDGHLVAEGYQPTGGPQQTHAVLSVTKSLVGCVAGILADRGQLELQRDVVDYVPELAESGYAGATVRQLLDMRSGVRFREDYTNQQAEIRRLDRWIVGASRRSGGQPHGLYPFLQTLRGEAPHGSRFLYRSSETDALGWACERAGGARMADLISGLVWAPMGAERDAEIFCDGLGTAVHDGGLAATARDLLRFGQMLLDGGVVPDGEGGHRTVVPPRWLRDAWAVNAEGRSLFLESPNESSFPGGWYRSQFWFRPGEHGDVLLCLGIHGQMVHVSRRTGTVCVKLSSWPQPSNPAYLQDTLRAFDAVGGAMLHRPSTGERQRLPGVVSGLTRGAATSRRGTAAPLD